MLLVFDRDDNLLTILNNGGQSCPYDEPIHRETDNGENTFEFIVPADEKDSIYIVEGNQVAFKDLDDNWQMFEIKRITDIHEDNMPFKHVFCEHVFYELLGDYIRDLRPTNTTAHLALMQALSDSRWEVGIVHDLGLNSTNFYYESALSAVQKVARVWGGELRYRLNIVENKIVNRYVDLLIRRGSDTGKMFEYGKDIVGIEREVDTMSLSTALYGRGRGIETEAGGFGRRLTFADVEWKVANGDPVDKPIGQEWVGDPEALEKWGKKLSDGTRKHIFDTFDDPQEEDPVKLLEKTWNELKKRKEPIINYRMKVLELERQIGYEHEKVRFGDTVRIKDTAINPPILSYARIREVHRNILRPEETEIVLGSFKPSIEDKLLEQEKINQTIRDKQGIWEEASEPFRGPVPTTWLRGVIDVLTNQLNSSESNWYTDEKGALIFEAIDGSSVMKITGEGFMIANKKDEEGQWIWETFGTGDGFTADLIRAGQIRTELVQILGDTHFYWDGSNIFMINPENQNEQIRMSRNGIQFTTNGGELWNVAIDYRGMRIQGASRDGYTEYRHNGIRVIDNTGKVRAHIGTYPTGEENEIYAEASKEAFEKGIYDDRIEITDDGKVRLRLSKTWADVKHLTWRELTQNE